MLQIPVSVAAPVLGAAAAITTLVDNLLFHKIWFGPVYLLLAALAAWLVGFRFAVAIGLAVLLSNFLAGNASTYPYGTDFVALNIAVKSLCVLAVAFMLGLARRSLEKEWRLARTDPLTGALNRQAFFEAIESESGRHEAAILVFADVDGLKHLNDQIGHERGDEALRKFADRVRQTIRKKDLFARIGGDEFVVFMKVKDEKAAKTVTNRLNNALNLEDYPEENRLRCSLGGLFLPAGSKSIDAELKLADKLMYSAKRVRAGFLMASAVQVPGKETELSALDTALPANLKSVVRQMDGSPSAPPENELRPAAKARARAEAV